MGPMILAIDCEFSIDVLKELLELGCDVNECDMTGRNTLHYACDLENEETIKFLLDNGVDREKEDQDGSQPFDDCPEILSKFA